MFDAHFPLSQTIHNNKQQVIRAALFSPPAFSASKLAVSYLPGVTPHGPLPLPPTPASDDEGRGASSTSSNINAPTPPAAATRTYTLTHNDLTGALLLSIGPRVNADQVRGLYTRLVRDEVVAEWRYDYDPPQGLVETAEQRRRRQRREQGRQRRRREAQEQAAAAAAGDGSTVTPTTTPLPSLHVYCHVSGEERWLAPPQLRAFVFRREMALVLSALRAGDRALLQASPELRSAPVYVHFQSHVEQLDTVEAWGTLGDSRSWPGVAFGGFGAGVGVGGEDELSDGGGVVGGGSSSSSSSSAWAEPLRRWAEGRPLLLALLGATATAGDSSLSEEDDEEGDEGAFAEGLAAGSGGWEDWDDEPATAAAAAAAAGSARRRRLLKGHGGSGASAPSSAAPAPAAPMAAVVVAAAAAGTSGGGSGGGSGATSAASSSSNTSSSMVRR